ncbi:hypothetical protein OG883_43440 [Streptomyces sp. NBC_01142]|uniref:hypothetical protein n=1 Tax=Streptomyces sp. NBC_01142 TaxID=2975865 RepID=UPI00225022A5|nr:hypothetical protein [Streptomyces sp. NBC_01142]MCX4826495.1 hypothetical protein [Streptomyces sp. NBC_01142]
MTSMRAVVITESLTGGELPAGFSGMEDRRYPHLLDERTPIEIIELTVPGERAAALALALSAALKSRLFYTHLIDETRMLVVFPRTVVDIPRGDEDAIAHARAVGALFDIPDDQMRFAEMWDTDHPDAPAQPEADAR